MTRATRGLRMLSRMSLIHRIPLQPISSFGRFRSLSLRHLLFRFAAHAHERIDKVIDRLIFFRLTPHPD
jgi:hypothetical protein